MIKTKDGLEIFTQEWAVKQPKAALILTHGYGEHSGRYAHVGEALNSAGYSLYAYDLRGHGKSGGPRGHTPSMAHLLDDLSRVITRVKQQTTSVKIFVYGHSMGGNITLTYAHERPSGLAGVIANAPWIRRAIEGSSLQMTLARVMANLFPRFSQQVPALAGKLSRDTEMDDSGNSDPLSHRTMSAKLFAEVTQAAQQLLVNAPTLKVPLYLTHGTDDSIIALDGSAEYFERCGTTDKIFKTYEGGYHELHNDLGRDVYFSDMIDWLNRHTRA
jgi:alpha-beta hydrolase superfamily lysophospholipase